jgi:DNA-binding response OmpR family regulator
MSNSAVVGAVILIAEDDEMNREFHSTLFSDEGYHILCDENGTETLDAVHLDQVDPAWLDVIMPDKSGFELLQTIKARRETRFIPVVLVTGLLPKVGERIQRMSFDVDDFLSKPFNRKELAARARFLLRLKDHAGQIENAKAVSFTLALSIEAKDPAVPLPGSEVSHAA